MAKADLHCHSIYSEHPDEWFLQRLGAGESYTDPEHIYRELKSQGMDFVTITDHNRIGGVQRLMQKYDDVFMGVESTVYFPEDGCKIHVLVYGFNEAQFEMIQQLRTDVYRFRDYLLQENLAHSVAHATYSVNGRITADHLEKLLLLFNVFEGRNGGRNTLNNEGWMRVIYNLKPENIEDLRRKHGIEPHGDTPWFKGLTGGSDDHAGLFLGKCCTIAGGKSAEEFLHNLRHKRSTPEGHDNDFQSLVFAIYKIGLDFSRSKGKKISNSLFTQITDYIIERKELSLRNRLKLAKIRSDSYRNPDEEFKRAFTDLIDTLQRERDADLDKRFEIAYEKISDISDSFIRLLLNSFEKNIKAGNLLKIVRNISSSLPGIFVTIPFFSSIHHLYKNRTLIEEMHRRFDCLEQKENRHILWFTDTINDLNGVSITLNKVREYARKLDREVTVVSTHETAVEGENYLYLPWMYQFNLPHYESYEIRMPSLLVAMDKIYRSNPDEIIVSTPGPVGLLGVLAARLFNLRCTGIYHTDFVAQANAIENNESLNGLLETAVSWFYQQMDVVRVPTRQYIDILEERGIDRTRMCIFRRGIDTTRFRPRKHSRQYLQNKYDIADGIYFLYTGRVSRDKNIPLLCEAFKAIATERDDVQLLIAGEGPHRKEIEKKQRHERIHFLGRVDRDILHEYYAGCDFFAFPSLTDTYGMSVLEAQACGTPAIVSNEGGPQELVVNDQTGWVVCTNTVEAWTQQLRACIELHRNHPEQLEQMRQLAHDRVKQDNSWQAFFDQFRDELPPALQERANQ